METMFETVPVPESREACGAIAKRLETALRDVLHPARFEKLRAALGGYDALTPDKQRDLRAAVGWRAAMFLDDAWLFDHLDPAAGAPRKRDGFACWAQTQTKALRARAAAAPAS